MMKVAIVQPYTFPYLGYFQLINAVDVFVFYDDVNFIKKGWIHRNRLLNNGKDQLFSIPLRKASQNKLIKEIDLAIDEKWKDSFLKTLTYNYSKAPYFNETLALVEDVLCDTQISIADLASRSIQLCCQHMGINTRLLRSSEEFADNLNYDRADRLIDITKRLGGDVYINPQNGKALYNKEYFQNKGVKLFFLKPEFKAYPQYDMPFIAGLSIIDLLMFNSKEVLKDQLKNYTLE
jgi:hypothetical protein